MFAKDFFNVHDRGGKKGKWSSFRDAKRTIPRLSRNENKSAIEREARIPAQQSDRVRDATTNVHVSIATWMERTVDALFNEVHVYRAALLRA